MSFSQWFLGSIRKKERLTVSQWADKFRILPKSTSSEAGQWRTSRTPYLREIMDELSPMSPTEKVVVIKGTQLGLTECANNLIGYYIDYAPCPIGFWQPTVELAQKHAKQKLWEMRNVCPTIKEKVADKRDRNGGSTIMEWSFAGGSLSISGSNSGASFRSSSYKVVIADDVDGFAHDVENEGSPLDLIKNRTDSFADRKIYINSTPTLKNGSLIEEEYETTDQREFYLPCPFCGHKQPLTWANIIFEKDDDGQVKDEVYHKCAECGVLIPENKKSWMLERGEWIPKFPNRRHRGYKISSFYSPVGWVSWKEIVEEFLKAKHAADKGDKRGLKRWVNTRLAETWEEEGDRIEFDYLEKRREYYEAELPYGVLVLVAGIDTQDDRLEVEIVGYGFGKESWGIEYKQFMGDTTQQAVWIQLDNYLNKKFSFADGKQLGISCACIDSGGHRTTEVYDFCKTKEHRRIFAIKGRGGVGIPLVGKYTRSNKKNVPLFPIGDDTSKELLLSRLKVEYEGEGYCHFPREAEKGYDSTYFKGLLSERRVKKYVKGVLKITWEPEVGVRNEPNDCRRYAMAALEILNPNFDLIKAYLEKEKDVYKQESKPAPRRKIISKGIS